MWADKLGQEFNFSVDTSDNDIHTMSLAIFNFKFSFLSFLLLSHTHTHTPPPPPHTHTHSQVELALNVQLSYLEEALQAPQLALTTDLDVYTYRSASNPTSISLVTQPLLLPLNIATFSLLKRK